MRVWWARRSSAGRTPHNRRAGCNCRSGSNSKVRFPAFRHELERGMKLEGLLSGGAGQEGIRRLLISPAARQVLRRELGTLLSPSARLGSCRLRRVRFRVQPDIKLSATFEADVQTAGSDQCLARPISISWKPAWIGKVSAPKPDAIAMEDEARERGLAAPFRRLTAQIPEWGMRIQVAPLDTAFPQSVRVSDPEYVRGMLKSACASARYAAARRIRITAIRYYPGLRHVLRYDLLNRVERASVFAKVYNNGEGRGVYRVTAQAAEWLQTCAKGLTVLPPLAYVPNDFVVLYPLLLGEPLDEQLRNPRHNIGRQLERAGEIVRALHGAPETIARSLKPHSFEAEIAEVVKASRHISVLFPPAGALIKTILDR